jgi:hypothetical protein
MIFAAAVMATSCQKEKEKEENTEKAVSHFNPANLQIEDMNAYLEGFKEKMENAEAKGGNETMGIEEAAWHLSSVANHDFAQIIASHDTLCHDTLYFHVDVVDGKVSVADMNALYEEMSQAIVNFKKTFGYENPNFWFIGTKISENGEVMVPLTTMFIKDNNKYWGDHYWYLNSNTADSICALYLSTTTTYYADDSISTTGTLTILKYMLDLEATYSLHGGQYFTEYACDTFKYQNYTDPYYSPFYNNSRLYASRTKFHFVISYTNMCYIFDSYAGLAWGKLNLIMNDIVPTEYFIQFIRGTENKDLQIGNHKMMVDYKQYHTMAPPPGPGNDN